MNNNKKKIEDAAYLSDTAAETINSVVNMLDAVTTIFRPIDDGDATPAMMEDMWRMSDAILTAARTFLTDAADNIVESSENLMEVLRETKTA